MMEQQAGAASWSPSVTGDANPLLSACHLPPLGFLQPEKVQIVRVPPGQKGEK